MNALEKIIQIAQGPCPPTEFEYVVVYGIDNVYDAIQSVRATKPLIVIAVGRDMPTRQLEDGTVTEISSSFLLYYRRQSQMEGAVKDYERYIELRNEFAVPHTFGTDGEIAWQGGEMSHVAGLAEPTIDLQAVSSIA